MNEETFKISDLILKTDKYRNESKIVPDKNDTEIPESIFQFEPVIWEEDNVFHTLLGDLPDEGIWTIGTTPLESMKEFDKELSIRLNNNKEVEPIAEEKRQEIHKEVFKKIDKKLGFSS